MSDTSQNQGNPLDPANVLHIFDNILPRPHSPETAGSTSNVLLKSGHDALAAAFHAIMLAVDFRFVGLGEDGTIGSSQDTLVPLPPDWNANGPDSYSFRYKHPQSALTFLIKSMRLSNKFLIHGMGIEDNKTFSLEVITNDYTSPSFFPYTGQGGSEPLINAFISQSRVKDLISLYKLNIIQNLIPNLNKPGYEETATTATTSTQPRASRPEANINNPLRIPTRQPPPIFNDPFGGYEQPSFENPFSIGREDLDPLGSNPIMGPPRFGGGGIQPLRGPSRGGGMYVGPDHPIFGPRGSGGIYGGPQPLPRGAVPPGARFDPIGPFDPFGNPLGPIPGQPQRGGFGPRQFSSGEPDNDELPPPGYNDMFM
ncbi:hypothetical protein G9A89_004344 [Geosiphon pyriformis]|nr:hypothetical protein G9A89_004344 [Geosiphon pyriformis]